jgi:MoxR-like ATPase
VQTVPDPTVAPAIALSPSPNALSGNSFAPAPAPSAGISFSSPPTNHTQPLAPPISAGAASPPVRSPSESELNLFRSSSLNYGSSKSNSATRELFQRIQREIHKLFVGQDELVLGTLVALFSGGHILIESVPGLGKTLFVRTLGRVLGCNFGRIQFTADLMPSDITGAPIFNIKTQEFDFRPGPVFTQILLADEINRSPAKTHAALLEIMQEYRVTVDGTSHTLQRPFLVMATQNPIESEGTYNLPEAQLDRFMFKLVANYPAEREEAEILRLHSQEIDINRRLDEEVSTVTSPEEILRISQENSKVHVDEKLIDYINKLVRMTRNLGQFHMGASPRAGLSLMRGARTLAAFEGRDYAVPDDVVHIALPTLRHRVILTAEAEVEGHKVDDVLAQMIRSVEVPRL